MIKDGDYTYGNTKFRICGRKYYGNENGTEIQIACYKNHYFIFEKTKYTTDYIKHRYEMKEDIPDTCFNKRYHRDRWESTKESKRFITSLDLIKTLYDCKQFEPITYENSRILSTTLFNKIPSLVICTILKNTVPE